MLKFNYELVLIYYNYIENGEVTSFSSKAVKFY